MAEWMPAFVVVTALAVVLQMAILAAMYLQFRQLNERVNKTMEELHSRTAPILSRIQILVEDTQPRISGMVADAAEITHLARNQAQRIDRVFSEAVDRLRLQLIHADQILTGTLESIEQAGSRARRTLLGPVQEAAALIKGIQVGLDFFRSRGRGSERPSEQQDEGLFI